MAFPMKPQDQRDNKKIEVLLTASQFERVRLTAEQLNNSSMEYVIQQLIEHGCDDESSLLKKTKQEVASGKPEQIQKTPKPGKRDDHPAKTDSLAAAAS